MAEPPDITGDLFPDAAAIRQTLERHTRDALLKRLGGRQDDPPLLPLRDPAERRKARGIGFGLELIRAILAGQKTQTRRVIRPLPTETPEPANCPTARPGELLYAREPWLRVGDGILYAADEVHATGRRYKPAMYMPRDATRLWLRVSGVRVERLQAISPADLAAEGLPGGQTLAAVWDSFYAAPGETWADDPWVWVIAFAVESLVPSPLAGEG